MKNLKPYSESAFLFYEQVVKSKNVTKEDPNYKTRLESIVDIIKKSFEDYDDNFLKNSLEALVSLSHSESQKVDLLKLYSFKGKVFQSLKQAVTTTESKRIINTCQNCTINSIDSFDHYLPKSEFAEFVVNPKNLIPSCSYCNKKKSSNWRMHDLRLFINFYLDPLPDLQYLFVDVVFSDGIITTNFYLDNPNNIENNLYQLISKHYSQLELCKLFSENNDSVITPLINDVKQYASKLSREELKEGIIGKANQNRKAFGHNYWKSILEIELANKDDFFEYAIKSTI